MNKAEAQNFVDLTKNALNVILITFFAICGYIFINLKSFSILDFIACILALIILALLWSLIFTFFKQYNTQIKD